MLKILSLPIPAPGALVLALAALLVPLLTPSTARAETVIERAARTGVISLGGPTNLAPYSFLNEKQQPTGYGIAVAERIAAEVSRYLGKPITLDVQPVNDPATLFRQVKTGEVDLVCGAQFTWEREMFVDFTLPFSLSGIRMLTPQGRLSGSADSLLGKRVGVVADSLGDRAIKALQPRAVRVPVAGLNEGVSQLVAGQLDAVAGDSLLVAAALQRKGAQGFALVPEAPLARYAVGCMLPENNSTFRNLANLAVAKLIQGYLNDNKADVQLVNRWLGPEGMLGLPPQLIKDYFQTVLLNHEQILVPATSSATPLVQAP
ncbi:extracellular substrate binding-like orphan protein GrrP [Synechococcus sp. CS-1326]|nr:extracellular substrate binding-like orphan protein GrrP [Synechococcus sp. CS-1326]